MSVFSIFEKDGSAITIRELKEWLSGIPDTDEDGEEIEVWIGTLDGYSNEARCLSPLDAGTCILISP